MAILTRTNGRFLPANKGVVALNRLLYSLLVVAIAHHDIVKTPGVRGGK